MHNLRRLQLRRNALFRASLTTPAATATLPSMTPPKPMEQNKPNCK